MADTLALHCRIAVLETELRLTKELLRQYQDGGIQLVNLLAQNSQGAPSTNVLSAEQKEIADLRFQLHDAGERIEELERSLKTVRGAKDVLLNLRKKERADATKKEANPDGDVGWNTYAESCAETIHDGPEIEDSTIQVPNYGRKQQWARDQANLKSADTKSGRADPPPATIYCGKKVDYFSTAPWSYGNNEKEVSVARQESKVATPEEAPIQGTRIEGSNGQVFWITPASPDETDWMERAPANGAESPRTTAQRLKDRFAPDEYNHLLERACDIEDKEKDEYEIYWEEYAIAFNGHSEEEWRTYYETVIRPVYLEELERARRDEEVAKWRGFAEDKEDEGETPEPPEGDNDVEKEQASSSADHEGVAVTCLLDMNDFTSSGKCVGSPDTGLQSPILPNHSMIEVPSGRHGEPQLESTDSRTLDVVAEDSRPGADEIVQDNEVEGSEGVQAPTKPSTTGPTTTMDPENVTSQPSIIEEGTARPIHIRSYSKEEVKRQEISRHDSKASVSPAAPQIPVQPKNQLSDSMHAPKDPAVPRPKAPLPWQQFVSRNGGSPDPTLRRTILITNIPTSTALTTVLDNIQGGRLLRIRYVDTARMQTRPPIETNTVLIEFIANIDARRFCASYTKDPMTLLSGGKTHTANVTLIPTASKPIPFFLSRGLREEGWSRVLYVHGDIGAEELVGKIEMAWGAPRRPLRTKEESGLMTLEYMAVEDAVKAFEVLGQEPAVEGMAVGFLPDPCAIARVVEVGGEGE